MNYFLLSIIVVLCGAGYYEQTTMQQRSAADLQQITDLGTQLDALKTENQKLTNDKAQMTKSAAATQAEVADLTQRAQAAQSALAAEKEQALEAAKAAAAAAAVAAAPPPPPPPPRPSNDLGAISTTDGKSYPNCQLLKVHRDGIVINCENGIIEIKFNVMLPDLQKRFGYDPQLGAALTDDQVQIQEEKRKSATQFSGN